LPLGLRRVEVLDDALVVLLDNVLGDTLHAEDLDVKALPVRECILDACEVFFVNLVHVDGETWRGCDGQYCSDRGGERARAGLGGCAYLRRYSIACRIGRT
jgi:hypothetical protein